MIYGGNYYNTDQLLTAQRDGRKVILVYSSPSPIEVRLETPEMAQEFMDKICSAVRN